MPKAHFDIFKASGVVEGIFSSIYYILIHVVEIRFDEHALLNLDCKYLVDSVWIFNIRFVVFPLR